MRTRSNNLVKAAFIFSAFILFASSADAQWTMVRTQSDAAGHLTHTTEKHRNGRTRVMNRQYFPGTHIIATERVSVFDAAGNPAAVMFERRDRLNRLTYQSNETMRGGRMTSGYRQRFTFRNAQDRSGRREAQRYNLNTRAWTSA